MSDITLVMVLMKNVSGKPNKMCPKQYMPDKTIIKFNNIFFINN